MNRIKQLREEKGISQSDVANAVGITRQAVSLYEQGKREPKLEIWQKLAEFFGVTVPYLQGVSLIQSRSDELGFLNWIDTMSSYNNGFSDYERYGDLTLDEEKTLFTFANIGRAIVNTESNSMLEDQKRKYDALFEDVSEKLPIDRKKEIDNEITALYLLYLDKANNSPEAKNVIQEISKLVDGYFEKKKSKKSSK